MFQTEAKVSVFLLFALVMFERTEDLLKNSVRFSGREIYIYKRERERERERERGKHTFKC